MLYILRKDNMTNLECERHGVDYRIICEECSEKWGKMEKVVAAGIEDNNQNEQTLEGS